MQRLTHPAAASCDGAAFKVVDHFDKLNQDAVARRAIKKPEALEYKVTIESLSTLECSA